MSSRPVSGRRHSGVEMGSPGYVGRVAEREQLTQLWGQAREGSLRLALVSGETGVGKTRLSTHVAFRVRGEGATVSTGAAC